MLLLLSSLSLQQVPLGKVGGYQSADASHLDQSVQDAIKDHLKQHSLEFESCEIVRLETQVVAGLNYKVTLSCPQREPFTVVVYKKLNNTVQVTFSELDQKKEM